MNIYSSNSTAIVHHFRKPVNCICCKKELSSANNLTQHYNSHNHNPIQSSDLFLDNKYTNLYFKLVSKEMYDGYTEKHHIIPRSLGGDNSKENIISISARYHFLCHYLLTKMVPENTKEWRSLIKAFNMMNANSDNHPDRYMNARLFESNRKHMSETMSINSSGENNSQHGTMWIMEISTGESIRIKKEEWNSYDKSVYKKGRSYDKDLYLDKMKNPDLYWKIGYEKRKEPVGLRNCLVNENLPESERYLEENLKGARRLSYKNKLGIILGYDFNNDDIDYENLKLRDVLIDLHHNKKLSIMDISKQYNLNRNSVVDLFDFVGVEKIYKNKKIKQINKCEKIPKRRSSMLNESLPESERYLEENLKGAKQLSVQNNLAKKLCYDFNNKDIDFENLKLRNILLDLYVEKKMSIPMICKEYDANIRSVELLLIFCGIPRRSAKEMHNTK